MQGQNLSCCCEGISGETPGQLQAYSSDGRKALSKSNHIGTLDWQEASVRFQNGVSTSFPWPQNFFTA